MTLSQPAVIKSSLLKGFDGCFRIENVDDGYGALFVVEPLQFIPFNHPRKKRIVIGWAPDEDAFLINARVHNHTFSQICKRMGRTRNSCIGRHGRLVKAGLA